MTAAAPTHCIVCGLLPRVRFVLSNHHPLRQCPRCGLAWWDFPRFEPAAFYDREYFQSSSTPRGYDDYAALEPALRRTCRARLSRLEALWRAGPGPGAFRTDRHLLDVGCGTGVFLDEALRAGWDACGIEVSAYAAAQAAAAGISVRCAAVEDVDLPVSLYDCVTMWDVLEHLSDPLGVLKKIAQSVRPGGLLALSTGDISSLCARLCGSRWHLFNLPEHLFFFTPASLTRLLRMVGCRPVRLVREVNWVPLGYAQERIAKMLALRRRPARWRWQRLVLPATLFDVIGVYARRG